MPGRRRRRVDAGRTSRGARWWSAWPTGVRAAGKWAAGILAAAAAAAIAGLLTGTIQGWFESESEQPQLPFTSVAEAITYSCDYWWVPGDPSAVEFEDELIYDPPQWDAYAMADGGAPASPSLVRLTVQGRTETAVVLTGLEIRVVDRRPAPEGTILHDPCGDAGSFRAMIVDLDGQPPRVEPWFSESILDLHRDQVAPAERRPIRFPYTVRASAPETFDIQASTIGCDCDWVAVLSWSAGGETGRLTIDDDGRPFRTVSREATASLCSSAGECR